MMQKANNKLLIGALLTGMSLLSGNALLMTVAGGVGVNWTSEGLGEVWQRITMPSLHANTPLEQVYRESLQAAVRQLRQHFKTTLDSRTPTTAFDLLEATFKHISLVQPLYAQNNLKAPQQVIDSILPSILYGHDERQVNVIQQQLLAVACESFQQHLLRNHSALTEYNHWLLQQLSTNGQAIHASLSEIQTVLHQLQQANHAELITALQASIATLAEQLATQAEQSSGGSVFAIKTMEADEIDNIAGNHLSGFEQPPHLPTNIAVPRHGNIFDISSLKARKITNIAGTSAEYHPSKPPKHAIVAAFSSPLELPHLRLRSEAKLLESIITPSARYELHTLIASDIDDLSKALSQHHPVIVHLAGHGESDEYLMENDAGYSQPIDYSALLHELGLHVPPLLCLVINACYSVDSIADVPLTIPFVIAMNGEINDSSAIEFTRGFYESLEVDASIPLAYAKGCSRIALKGKKGHDIPQLFEQASA